MIHWWRDGSYLYIGGVTFRRMHVIHASFLRSRHIAVAGRARARCVMRAHRRVTELALDGVRAVRGRASRA
jgi:hypothetical protein